MNSKGKRAALDARVSTAKDQDPALQLDDRHRVAQPRGSEELCELIDVAQSGAKEPRAGRAGAQRDTLPSVAIPRTLAWLLPEHDPSALDPDRDARRILARVLEHGRMQDVRWCVAHYGMEGIHRFFRSEAHPEITPRTIALWRVTLNAKGERWRRSRRSRLLNAAPWPL